jgi:hypothetical protein
MAYTDSLAILKQDNVDCGKQWQDHRTDIGYISLPSPLGLFIFTFHPQCFDTKQELSGVQYNSNFSNSIGHSLHLISVMASTNESNQGPLEICRSLFAALNSGNYKQMYNYIIPTGHAALRRTDAEGPQILTMTLPELLAMAEGLVKSMFEGKKFEETFDDPEVRIDEDLAMVWVKTRLLADGKEVGRGTNVIALHKMKDGEWKISSITDRCVIV